MRISGALSKYKNVLKLSTIIYNYICYIFKSKYIYIYILYIYLDLQCVQNQTHKHRHIYINNVIIECYILKPILFSILRTYIRIICTCIYIHITYYDYLYVHCCAYLSFLFALFRKTLLQKIETIIVILY